MPRTARIFSLTILGIVLFPFSTFAADASTTPDALTAGFASTPIWISSTNPIDGDSLKLFTVVKNSAATAISGVVSFAVDGTDVGTVNISLAIGSAQVLSVPWRAVVGTHSITAVFNQPVDANKQSVSLRDTVAGPLTITVGAAPPKALALQYLDTATSLVVPAFSGIVGAVENIRKSGADYFAEPTPPESGTTNTPSVATSSPPGGRVLGAATENLSNMAAVAAPQSSFLKRIGFFIFDNPLLFYPLFLLVLFLAFGLILHIFSRN